MSDQVNRRRFLGRAVAGSVAMGVAARAGAQDNTPSRTVVVGIMGTGGRGTALAQQFQQQPDCDVAYVCGVDKRRVGAAAAAVQKISKRMGPKAVTDFRRILDDRSVDVLVCAAPDHWHAPATILACAAGKHVYVEKPCSHNPREGELQVAAARKHDRVVQVGTQRRSYSGVIEAISKLHDGAIGRVLFSRGWYNNQRGSIGRGKEAPVPDWLDFELWQGPAPRRAFRDNILHYNWHWFWHWGTGELGNNGVHALDLCRWGCGVDYPRQVSSGGGLYYFDDDQETPDSQVITFDFGDKMITWEGRNWSRRGFEGEMFGAAFYGDRGSMVLVGNGYKIYDRQDKLVEENAGGSGNHVADFLDCIRTERRPHADIEIGHKSALLCHLGSIAHRTGRTLHCDPENGHILDEPKAEALWSREYEPGWEPKV